MPDLALLSGAARQRSWLLRGVALAPRDPSILLSQVGSCERGFGRTLSLAAFVDPPQNLLCPIQPFLCTASALYLGGAA